MCTVRVFCAIVATLLTGSLLTAPAAAATSHKKPDAPGAVAGVPRYADARMVRRKADRVKAITRIDVYRRRDVSKRSQADYITAQVLVNRPRAKTIEGPVTRSDLDGPDRARRGARLRVVPKSGLVEATLPLTTRQRKAIGRLKARQAKQAVKVVFRHYRDASKQRRIHEDIASVGATARFGGYRLRQPRRTTLSSSSAGTVMLFNETANPLVIMAGPNSCMYDSMYGATYSGDHGSHLGTLNGVILQPAQSISAYVLNDKSDLDGQEENNYGTQVFDDYNDYLNDAWAQASAAGTPTLPELDLPEGDDESPWLDMDLSMGFFGREMLSELLDDEGLWGTFAAGEGAAAGLTETEIDAFAPFLETVATGAELFEEPVVEVVLELYELFANSCMSHDGYITIGAMDQTHPWRQFMQVYDWGNAQPSVPKPGKQGYTSLNNGIVGSVVSSTGTTAPDSPTQSSEPWILTTTPTTSIWYFREADTPVDQPAQISWDKGTRDVTCEAADPYTVGYPDIVPAAYDSMPPYQVTKYFDGSSAAGAGNYLIGLHYITGQSTGVVHYSQDGITWQDVDIPQWESTVTLPKDGKAVLVKCDLQVNEIFSNATLSGRKALMGTRVTSDIINGPDYVSPPTPGSDLPPAGSITLISGPTSGTQTLLPTPDGLWWANNGAGAGFRQQATGDVEQFPKAVARVMTPDGKLWATTNTGTAMSSFDPSNNVRTDYPIKTHNPIWQMTLGPDGWIWFLESPGYLGKFNPANQSYVEYPLPLTSPTSLFTGPDSTIWVTTDGSYMRFSTTGQSQGPANSVPTGLGGPWAIGPAPSGMGTGLAAWAGQNSSTPQVVAIAGGTYRTWPAPNISIMGLTVDAQANVWIQGQTGSNTGGASINRMTPDGTFTQWPMPYRPSVPMTIGPDGQVYVGGDNYWDYRILRVSTGSSPAVKKPWVQGAFVAQGANCIAAQWYRPPSKVNRYWIDADTGKRLGSGDSLWLGMDLDGTNISCVEQATLPWLKTPVISVSDPVEVTAN